MRAVVSAEAVAIFLPSGLYATPQTRARCPTRTRLRANVFASPMLYSNRQIIFQQVAALHLPAIYQFAEMAEEGGLLAYGPRFSQIIRDIYVRQLVQLFRGAKVTDIPVEQPTKFELVINLRTAKTLGLNITESFLQRADKVIE